MKLFAIVRSVADLSVADGNFSKATFDQLAEEVMELHLALRGKHKDTPAMEWLEIATIAINALRILPHTEVEAAYREWCKRHDRGKPCDVSETRDRELVY